MPFKEVKARLTSCHEFNPMLGHRGCRLGIVFPEITARCRRGRSSRPQFRLRVRALSSSRRIMIPLVGNVTELKAQEEVCSPRRQ
jgi:pyruvate,orthophosphate dikinase